MIIAILYFLLSAILVDFIGYWLHRWSHKKHSILYKPHMTHHLITYPPKSVLSDKYKSSGIDGLAIWFSPIAIILFVLVLLLGIPHPIAILLGGLLTGISSSVIHDMTHLSGSVVWRVKFLKGIAIRHHAHHFKMRRNYGIITDLWDRVFLTRRRL